MLIEHKEAEAPTTNSPQTMRAGGGPGKGGAGRRAGFLARRTAAADAAVPRHHLRLLPGAHAEGLRLAPGLRNAAFQPAAPLRGASRATSSELLES